MRHLALFCAVWSWWAVCALLGFPVLWAVDLRDRNSEPLTRKGLVGWACFWAFVAAGVGMIAGGYVTRWIDCHPVQGIRATVCDERFAD